MENQTTKNESNRMQSFEEFWPFYLGQHARPICRYLHLFGTSVGILILLNGLRHGRLTAIFPALVVGYGFSWIGHFFFEKNRPATFTYPKWSFQGDFKMMKLFYTGRLNAEIKRLNIVWKDPVA